MTKLDYKYRPSKAVQRSMIVDVCRLLVRIAKPEEYQYVGFGGLEFVDFDLMHRSIGISEMISVEKDSNAIARYEFNVPFRCIRVLAGTASESLPRIDWNRLSLVWLDYECQLTRSILVEELSFLCARLQPGSALFLTVNATPGTRMADRRDQLVQSVGEDRIPSGVTNESLGVWGLADVQRTILSDAIAEALRSRSVPTTWYQIFNTYYTDVSRMQTLGGIVSNQSLQRTLDHCGFSELEFVRTDAKPFVIRVPMLTRRERTYLESQLPLAPGKSLDLPGLSEADKTDFLSVYRYAQTGTFGS